jgi:CBS-domain-containing membrane protein
MGLKEYVRKMKGGGHSPPRVSGEEIFLSWLNAFFGMGLCGLLSFSYFEPEGTTLLIGSFGASAVLLYVTPKSPFAQPRNLLGGHLISAAVGVLCFELLGCNSLGASLAVASSIALMHITRTLHPPGGATALIAVIGGPKIHDLGFLYILVPTGLGATVLLLVALFLNNLSGTRRYPEYWI